MDRINNKAGQNIIEYILIFAVVLIVVISVLSPWGFFKQQVGNSLEMSMEGIECMAVSVCYDPDPHPCAPVCGDGCCQQKERDQMDCPKDCDPKFSFQ